MAFPHHRDLHRLHGVREALSQPTRSRAERKGLHIIWAGLCIDCGACAPSAR